MCIVTTQGQAFYHFMYCYLGLRGLITLFLFTWITIVHESLPFNTYVPLHIIKSPFLILCTVFVYGWSIGVICIQDQTYRMMSLLMHAWG